MKTKKTTPLLAAAGIAVATLGLIAWKNAGDTATQPVEACHTRWEQDTTRPNIKVSRDKREYRIGDLDKAMKELDKAMIDVEKNTRIDFGKMEGDMKRAMEDIKKIDAEKIALEVEASLKKIDWENIQKSVERSLREAEATWKEVNGKKMEAERAKIKEEIRMGDLTAKLDMDQIKKQIDIGMAKAKEGIAIAKKELAEMKAFIDSLEKDGLINKKKGFRIEIRNKKLFINGNEQPKDVNDRYSKYLNKEDYGISSDGDNYLSI